MNNTPSATYSKNIDERIERAKAFTIKDKYLIRYFLKYLCSLNIKDMTKGYDKTKSDEKLSYIFDHMKIDKKEGMKMRFGKFLEKLDWFLTTTTDETVGLTIITNIQYFFIGYPYVGHHIENPYIDGETMETMAGFVRLSAKGTMEQYKQLCGESAEININMMLDKKNKCRIPSNYDIGALLFKSQNSAFDRLDTLSEYDVLSPYTPAHFWNNDNDTRRIYMIFKNFVIDPTLYYEKFWADNQLIFLHSS